MAKRLPNTRSKKGDDGFRILAGRSRNKPWEQTIRCTVQLDQETYQRVMRLSKRKRITRSKAVMLLIKTQESEAIEPTLPVDYSAMKRKGSYSVTNILG
jgi:macrodomain Ter protein organizer (MatP/YcbG family)